MRLYIYILLSVKYLLCKQALQALYSSFRVDWAFLKHPKFNQYFDNGDIMLGFYLIN